MGKYLLYANTEAGPGEEIESDFLPRKMDAVVYNGTTYWVRDIRHRIVEKEGRLEAKVEVYVRV